MINDSQLRGLVATWCSGWQNFLLTWLIVLSELAEGPRVGRCCITSVTAFAMHTAISGARAGARRMNSFGRTSGTPPTAVLTTNNLEWSYVRRTMENEENFDSKVDKNVTVQTGLSTHISDYGEFARRHFHIFCRIKWRSGIKAASLLSRLKLYS